jgi:4-oxalocrotonate tautomerase
MTLVEGRESEAVERCMRELARTVHRELGAPMSAIRVVVDEVPPSRWAVGDRLKSEENQ